MAPELCKDPWGRGWMEEGIWLNPVWRLNRSDRSNCWSHSNPEERGNSLLELLRGLLFPGGKAAGHVSERLASLQRPCASAVTAFPELMPVFPQQLPARAPCLQGCWPGRLPGSQVPLVLPGSRDLWMIWVGRDFRRPHPTSCSDIKPACLVLYMDYWEFPGLSRDCCSPQLAFDIWALWFLGWPGPNLFDHQTSELPAFQATENAEAVLWKIRLLPGFMLFFLKQDLFCLLVPSAFPPQAFLPLTL